MSTLLRIRNISNKVKDKTTSTGYQ